MGGSARARLRALGVVVAAAITAGIASCSLGLDESLIDRGVDGGFGSDGTTGDGATILPGGDGGSPEGGGAIACTTDAPCTSTDGCLKGHCDLGRHVCVFDVCRATCASGSCSGNTCGTEAPYTLKVTQIPLGGSVVTRGAVAIYPWLFVILPTGLVAFDVSNPANPAPAKTDITNLPFTPTQITAAGNRLWMTGPVPAQAASVPIAYLDIPTNPRTTTLAAQAATATIDNGTLGSFFLLPAASAGGNALLAGAGTNFPTAAVNVPFGNPTTLTPVGIPAAPGDVLQGVATGGRVLLGSEAASSIVSFHLIEAAGTPNAKSDAVVQMGTTGPVSSGAIAGSNEGAIVWATGNNVTPAPPGPNVVTAAHAGFLVDDAQAAIAAAPPGADLEIYSGETANLPTNTPVVGPPALLDGNTALVTALAHEDPGETSVQFLRRNPLGLVKEADGMTVRRVLLPVPVSTIVATTASDGIAYVVANGITPPNLATVYVFDVGCAP
jgi:hypothetical protein